MGVSSVLNGSLLEWDRQYFPITGSSVPSGGSKLAYSLCLVGTLRRSLNAEGLAGGSALYGFQDFNGDG
jgi:hypothetical protein